MLTPTTQKKERTIVLCGGPATLHGVSQASESICVICVICGSLNGPEPTPLYQGRRRDPQPVRGPWRAGRIRSGNRRLRRCTQMTSGPGGAPILAPLTQKKERTIVLCGGPATRHGVPLASESICVICVICGSLNGPGPTVSTKVAVRIHNRSAAADYADVRRLPPARAARRSNPVTHRNRNTSFYESPGQRSGECRRHRSQSA